jgi:hypothetical protein
MLLKLNVMIRNILKKCYVLSHATKNYNVVINVLELVELVWSDSILHVIKSVIKYYIVDINVN